MKKKFYKTNQEFDKFHSQLKQTSCPHCNLIGCLILHGLLKGYVSSASTPQKRGHRIYCSNKNKRKGCGRTFTVFISNVIKRISISTQLLWDFLKNIAAGTTVSKAFNMNQHAYSLKSIYRLYHKFRHRQSYLRVALTQICETPPHSFSANPISMTIEHFCTAFAGEDCPIAAFQRYFQSSIL